jgi:hypothetical protein
VRYVRAWKGPISERTGVPKPHIAKRGRLGDATLPALRARDKRQAMELRIVANHIINRQIARIEEERIHPALPGFKSHFLPSRFLSGSRAWKFRFVIGDPPRLNW